MARKKRKRNHKPSTPRPICGWCGKPIAEGAESDNYYEIDEQWATLGGPTMGPVHKAHVREEDHPLYEQLPHMVFTGVPAELDHLW